MKQTDFYWLVGIFEGEGSFMAPPPSSPNAPRACVSMTDQDVVERIGKILQLRVSKSCHARAIRNGWKPAFTVTLSGRKAVNFMNLVYPHMGIRRRGQIKRALAAYDPTKQTSRWKVKREQAFEIRERALAGESAKKLAAEFNIKLGAVYDIKNERCHRQ